MRASDLVAQIGGQITPTAVRDYSKSRGWQLVEGSRQRRWILRHPDAGLRQIIVPIDQDDAWTEALQEVVLRLAALEQRPFDAVLSDLQTVDADVVRFRIGGKDVAAGMLPMSDATGLIEGARRALLASACSVVNKVLHHARMARSEAEEFLRVCRLGQTEVGSYVVKVVCPLSEMEEPPLLREAQPFAREATMVLMRACSKIVDGIEKDNLDKVLENDSAQPDITSNLCEALLRMHAARDSADLSVETTWASLPKYPVPDGPRSAVFKPEYFRTVEEIQRQRRPQKAQHEETPLFGTVEMLNGDVGDDGRRSGEVEFSLLLPDEELIRARGNLSADDYEKAVHAHEMGQGYVAFSGVLKRGIRSHRVEGIKDFRELSTG